jgi:hypothetical protein
MSPFIVMGECVIRVRRMREVLCLYIYCDNKNIYAWLLCYYFFIHAFVKRFS